MPSAIIVGPQSMLGSRLKERLVELDWNITTAGRSPQCDIHIDLERGALDRIHIDIQADVLFHCAGSFGDDSISGSLLNEKVNALGSHIVAELSQVAGCRKVLYAGSIFSSNESSSRERMNSYGASKARGEEILSWWAGRTGQNFTSVRLAQFYDERGSCVQHQPWFGRIVSYARKGLMLRLPPGENLRNFIHVRDAVDCLIAAVEKEVYGIVSITHPLSLSYKEIALQAYEVFGCGGAVQTAPEKKAFQDIYIPDGDEAWRRLKLTPRSMRDGLFGIKNAGYAEKFEVFDVS